MKPQIVFVILTMLILACAKQGFPPGGPVDKSPPRILETFPKSDTTNIALDTKIEVEFNETVDQRSCEESIYMTPYPGDRVKYTWKGHKLQIELLDGLLENRTYVITIGAGTKDMRNNTMIESYSIAFSTGPTIDRGRLSGLVKGVGNIAGTEVWAYDLDENDPPNPAKSSPVYVTQANKDGSYKLTHLAFNKYRIFAVMDRDKNGLYDEEFDMIGITSSDPELSDLNPDASNLNFDVVLGDTTLPQLSDVSASDNRHVVLRFTEFVSDSFVTDKQNYSIQSGQDSLLILDVFQDSRNKAYIHLTTSEQQEKSYKLVAKNAVDLSGNFLNPDSGIVEFTGSAVPDTVKPYYLSMSPSDSSKDVPLFGGFDFSFSEAMDTASINQRFVFADTFGNDILGDKKWVNFSHLIFKPTAPLLEETLYQIVLPVDSVYDVAGNPMEDTLFVKKIITVNQDTLSEISGSIVDSDTNAVGPFEITARSVSGNSYIEWVDASEYKFERILPGQYILEMFRDEDGDGVYSRGSLSPYKPSERFYIFPDTISVRSKWPNEGNDIIFPL